MRGLLDRSNRALARCKAWMPSTAWRTFKDMTARIEHEGAAIQRSHPGAGDTLPNAASLTELTAAPLGWAEWPSCAACGKRSAHVRKCSACKAVAYW